MPLQNRVTPRGTIVRSSARGSLLGNRGCLHRAREIVRNHAGRRWIVCLLEFRGRRRPLMQEGRYTELFFLDEATALAAGHRPCAECRREAFERYRRAWPRAEGAPPPSAGEMDARLHSERIAPVGASRRVSIAGLPPGAMIELDGGDDAYLVLEDRLMRWTPAGYDRAVARPAGQARLLTPPGSVAVLSAGYRPLLHETAVLWMADPSPAI